jgi:hypothetical protein
MKKLLAIIAANVFQLRHFFKGYCVLKKWKDGQLIEVSVIKGSLFEGFQTIRRFL